MEVVAKRGLRAEGSRRAGAGAGADGASSLLLRRRVCALPSPSYCSCAPTFGAVGARGRQKHLQVSTRAQLEGKDSSQEKNGNGGPAASFQTRAEKYSNENLDRLEIIEPGTRARFSAPPLSPLPSHSSVLRGSKSRLAGPPAKKGIRTKALGPPARD